MSKPTEPSHRACVQITRNYVCDAMSDGEYYRRQAKEAQAHADRAIRDEDRVAWLRLAQSWLALLPFRKATPRKPLTRLSGIRARIKTFPTRASESAPLPDLVLPVGHVAKVRRPRRFPQVQFLWRIEHAGWHVSPARRENVTPPELNMRDGTSRPPEERT